MVSSFSEYYRKQAQAPSAPAPDYSNLPRLKGAKSDDGPGQTPLNWIIDMISRPLFGATTAVGGVLEGVAKAEEEGGNAWSAVGGILAAPTNFLAGLISADDSPGSGTKRTYGDLMEEYTDRFGKIRDPNYVDVENNVDPGMKGAAGLALDIVADPLTWIPGAAIAKPFQVAGKGLKIAASGAAGAAKSGADFVRGSRAAAKSDPVVRQADEAAPAPAPRDELEASDMLTPSPSPKAADAPVGAGAQMDTAVREFLDDAPNRLLQDQKNWSAALGKSIGKIQAEDAAWISDYMKNYVHKAPDAKAPAAKAVDVNATKAAKVVKDASRIGEDAEDLRKLVNSSKFAPAMRSEITKILANVGKPVQQAKKAGFPTAPEWAKANAKVAVGNLPGAPAMSQQLSNLLQTTSGSYRSPARTLERLFEIRAKAPTQELKTEALRAAQAMYKAAEAAAGTAKVSDDAKGVITAIEAFREAKAANEQKLNNILGNTLVETLSRKNTEKSMQRAMENVLKFLDPETDLVKFFDNNKQLAQAIQEGLQIPRHVKPRPNTVAEVRTVEEALKSEPRLAAAREAFVRTFKSEVEDIKKKYPYYDRGRRAYFTSEDVQVRLGRHRHDINTFFQYTLWKNAVPEIKKRFDILQGDTKAFGGAHAKLWRDAMHSVGDDIGRISAELGIPLGIGVRASKKSDVELLPISFDEVYRIVESGFDTETAALRALYNGNSNVAFTVLMQAAHRAATAGTDLTAAGRAALKKDLVDGILDPKKLGVRGELAGGEGLLPNRIANPGKMGKFDKSMPSGKQLAETLAEAILKSQDELVRTIAANKVAWSERGIAEAAALNEKVRKQITARIESGGYKTEIAEEIADIPKTVAADGTEIGASQAAVNAATEVANKSAGDMTVTVAKIDAKAVNQINSGASRAKTVEKASQDKANELGKHADDYEEVRPPGETAGSSSNDVPFYDLSNPSPVVAQQGFLAHVLHGAKVGFQQDYGIENLWNLWHSKKTVSSQFIEKTVQLTREFVKHSPDVQVAAVKAIQNGSRSNSNPAIADAIKQAEAIMEDFWRVSDDAANGTVMDNGFLAVEKNLDYVHDIMDMKGLPDTFRFSGKTLEEAKDAWKTWDITDPGDTFARLADAMATVAEKRSIVGNFVYEFTKLGHISTKPKPGFVRVGASGHSTFASLLPDGIYVQREMAKELHQLDILTRADRQLSGEVGTFLAKHYIPAQGIWKALVTVYRPGHHIRNFAGNGFMSWVARGNRHYVRSNRDAVKILSLRNEYNGVDLIDSLQRIGEAKVPAGGDLFVSGRLGDISLEEMYVRAQDNGLFTSHTVSEDLLLDASKNSRMAQLATRLNASRPGQFTGDVSQVVDHFGKMQHFAQIIRQESGKYGRWKNASKEEVFARAVREVKRSHPDANMLTTMEAKYRFLIPFYTWFAKTMPFAIESAARNPGRIAVFPKASYNIAVANGVNPDSLIDPFPDDQLFPSYITEGFFGPQFVGPDGEYVTVNPGVQHFDLFREIGADPIRGMAGMMSPIIKAPVELLTGGSMQTGARIQDTSDYIDQNLPIVNYIANLTGFSVSGSAAGLLTGQGLDPQRQVERGNKGDFDKMLTLSNWLTGMSATNLSRGNFINFAEIEKRDRAAEEAKK